MFARWLPAISVLLLASATSAVPQSGNIDTLLDAVVRVSVGKGPGRSPNIGTGFVVAVHGRRTIIVTARHLFYPNEKIGEAPYNPEPSVVFHADRQHSQKATLLPRDSEHAGISVLEVLDAGLGTLPRFQLRTQPLSRNDHVRVMGSDEDWSSPEMSIAALAYTDRTDWFTYSGTGLTPGYSGSPVVDLNGLLVGVHQGETDGGRRLGWAQRIQEVDETLVRVLGVTPDFGGLPSIPAAPPPTLPTAPATGTLSELQDGLKYVWIDSGKFIMGCSTGDSECYADEKPPHPVTITKGFWMGQTPVTQEAYRKVTGKSPSHFQGASLPVEQVSWDDALGYCKTVGLGLPTEAEWEYAARAGSAAARYGNLDEIASYADNSGRQRLDSTALWKASQSDYRNRLDKNGNATHPVGQKLPNSWGLYDMLGNVWEWVADWYDKDYYSRRVAVDPTGPDTGRQRVLRGGSWSQLYPEVVRASNRTGYGAADRDDGVGFRCAGELR